MFPVQAHRSQGSSDQLVTAPRACRGPALSRQPTCAPCAPARYPRRCCRPIPAPVPVAASRSISGSNLPLELRAAPATWSKSSVMPGPTIIVRTLMLTKPRQIFRSTARIAARVLPQTTSHSYQGHKIQGCRPAPKAHRCQNLPERMYCQLLRQNSSRTVKK